MLCPGPVVLSAPLARASANHTHPGSSLLLEVVLEVVLEVALEVALEEVEVALLPRTKAQMVCSTARLPPRAAILLPAPSRESVPAEERRGAQGSAVSNESPLARILTAAAGTPQCWLLCWHAKDYRYSATCLT